MRTIKNIFIITTSNDLSKDLIVNSFTDRGFVVSVELINDHSNILSLLDSQRFDYIYLRDPFNTENFDIQKIQELIVKFNSLKNTKIIDNLDSIDNLLLEDKWNQYQKFSKFMLQTKLFSKYKPNIDQNIIIKKRISSRAKGIFFDPKDVKNMNPDDLIFQPLKTIDIEYRVNVIFNEIVPVATIKSSKTAVTKVKIIDSITIPDDLKKFVTEIIPHINYDFYGMDIARVDGKFYLIEINRSPLFSGYFRVTGINLAEILANKLPPLC